MNNDIMSYINAMKTQQSIDSSPSPEATGISDDIPAKLSVGEFVINAEQVSKLGGGATDPGFAFLEELVSIVDAMDRETAVSFAETVLITGEVLLEQQPNITDEE